MNLVDICRDLIAIDSTPSNGNQEAAEFVASLAKSMGFDVELQSESLHGILQSNVIIRPPKSPREEELLLLSHLDTPDPGSYGLWTKTMANPFKASIYGDQMFGLGTAGAKLDLICKLMAARPILDNNPKASFVIVGSFGEQSNMEGAIKLIRRKKVSSAKALISKPTEMSLITAGCGITMVEVSVPFSEEEKEYHNKHNKMESSSTQSKIFSGRAALASHPKLGENAIMKMFEYLSNLPTGIAVMDMDGGVSPNTVPSSAVLEIDMVGGFKEAITVKITHIIEALRRVENDFKNYPAKDFDPEVSTLNVGQIRKFRDGIQVLGCCNILPSVGEEKAEQWMTDLARACQDVGGVFRISANKKPFRTSNDSSIVNLCQGVLEEMGLNFTPSSTAMCTEANVLSQFGIDCVVVGPGKGVGNTHEPNERVGISELEQAIDFYQRLLGKMVV